MHTCYYCRTRDAVVGWVKEKMNGGVHSVTEVLQAHNILMSESMIILGFLDALGGPDSKALAAVSELENDLIFYKTAIKCVAKMFHINPEVKRPALFMMRKDAGKFIQFDGPFTRLAMANFVSINKFPLATTFNLWLFAPEDDLEKLMSTFQEAAKAFNGKLLAV
ncbi:hypothetical protein JCGZ_18532 [Jatropha curcas]|uniref:Uncharacterized protein n=1 Tax=Jatropha curcas TaxID=180498 RepID=A0A067LK63_JATCU|nr:hypothetical protein JCGZ_18532 [Jatropha curcas]